MTINVFIGQPKKEKTKEFIEKEQKHLTEVARKEYGSDIFVHKDLRLDNMAHLGRGIVLLSQMDVLVLSSDWEKYEEYKILHDVAIHYGLDVIESYSKV